MKNKIRSIRLLALLCLWSIASVAIAQTAKPVTIRELNSYAQLNSITDIPNQTYKDSLVSFTAVIVAYPKNSGLASYTQSTDGLGRIHVFVTDTTALNDPDGKLGMSMQVVASDYSTLETLNRGDIIDVTGRLTFFSNTAQFSPETITLSSITGTDAAKKYMDLLNPIDVSVSDLNITNTDGTMQLNLANYPKYIGSYVKISGATVTNVSLGDRPNWALKQGNDLIYIYDTSLRYRNDRPIYRTGYNYRRTDFTPPPAGATVDVSGFITLNNLDPDSKNASGMQSMSINPWDDGIVWLNDVKYENGVNGFTWPNDVVVVGYPPAFSNYTLSNQTPTSTEQVTVEVDIAPNAPATLQSVEMIYNDGSGDQTVSMNLKSGTTNTYTYTFPTFANFKTVSFKIKATDSDGLIGEYPQGSMASFVVLDQPVTSISVIQQTSDGKPGPSPLAGVGQIPMNLTATVVADSADGFVVIQDSSSPWSGVYLDASVPSVKSLKRGDKITITKGEVKEEAKTNITYLTNFAYTVDSQNNSITDLIPLLSTQDITNAPDLGEAHEGMVITLSNVKVLTNQADGNSDYGEWEIGSVIAGADTLKPGQGLRIDDGVPTFGSGPKNISSSLNENIKTGVHIASVTGALYYTFGNNKLLLRNYNDVKASDWTYPSRTFSLLMPTDKQTVDVTNDVMVSWNATTDYDGNTVHYLWALANPADTAFTNPLVKVESANSGADANVTIPYKTVDDLLSNLGMKVGDTRDFIWTVYAMDTADTVQASTYSAPDFTPVYYNVTLKRDLITAIDKGNTLTPRKFALEQNYPNPFNPTTTIRYSLPQSSKVKLTVYDILGRTVAVLVNKVQNTGNYIINFDASRLSSGMYFYRLETDKATFIHKMLLIK